MPVEKYCFERTEVLRFVKVVNKSCCLKVDRSEGDRRLSNRFNPSFKPTRYCLPDLFLLKKIGINTRFMCYR